MYRIQDSNNRFIKKTVDNKITFTYSESLADIFPSEREANDFLRKMFNKKAREKCLLCITHYFYTINAKLKMHKIAHSKCTKKIR